MVALLCVVFVNGILCQGSDLVLFTSLAFFTSNRYICLLVLSYMYCHVLILVVVLCLSTVLSVRLFSCLAIIWCFSPVCVAIDR